MRCFLWGPVRAALAFGLFGLCLASPLRAQSVLVLGDSISAAYGMSLEQGWVALMARQLTGSHPQSTVINASISGETTGGGARRLPSLLERHDPDVVVIELGGNDGLRGYPVSALRKDLTDMVRRAQASGARVLLLPMEIPPNYGSRYAAAFRDSYPLVADNTGAALGSFLLDGVATIDGMMQADGIHPTEAAQARLVDNVLPALLALLEDR